MMVESKLPLYEHADATPIVPVTVTATVTGLEDATSATAHATTSAETLVLDGDGDDKALSSSSSSVVVDQDRMIGAGVACGLLGLLLGGGPLLAALAGFGAAYCARQDDPAGDVARALGDVALSARDKAKELDHKHRLVDKTQLAAQAAWDKAKTELNRHEQCQEIIHKVTDAVTFSVHSTVEFAKRYQLLERSVDGVGRSLYYVVDKLSNTVSAVYQTQFNQIAHDTTIPTVVATATTTTTTTNDSNNVTHYYHHNQYKNNDENAATSTTTESTSTSSNLV